MEIEFFKKDVACVKLTITPTRIHVKVPLDIDIDTQRYINFVNYVYDICTKEQPISFSLRSKISLLHDKLRVQLQGNNGKTYFDVIEV